MKTNIMKKEENLLIKESVYHHQFENGLDLFVIPKKGFTNKYVIWGTHYGSLDSRFIIPNEKEETIVPDGIAHFLEHKLFEQSNGTNSLETLTTLGASANAYTTFNHTAYLFEATENFYPILDEFMDYVQNPYFTDENVEKEKGIIAQEIHIGDDSPEWQVYFNFLKAAYDKFPLNKDIAGTVESIGKIDKDILFKCYNTFYHPSNMAIFFVGDFDEEEIKNEVQKRLKVKENQGKIIRCFDEEPESAKTHRIEAQMEVSMPLFILGYKLKPWEEEAIKRYVAVEILLELIAGKSSKTYYDLYDKGLLFSEVEFEYEAEEKYGYITLGGQSKDPDKVIEAIKNTITEFKNNGLIKEDFDRVKKMLNGEFVKQFNRVDEIARMFISDYFKGINTLDYIKAYEDIDIAFTENTLNEIFKDNTEVISIINPK